MVAVHSPYLAVIAQQWLYMLQYLCYIPIDYITIADKKLLCPIHFQSHLVFLDLPSGII
jgi:hypothetical protein